MAVTKDNTRITLSSVGVWGSGSVLFFSFFSFFFFSFFVLLFLFFSFFFSLLKQISGRANARLHERGDVSAYFSVSHLYSAL